METAAATDVEEPPLPLLLPLPLPLPLGRRALQTVAAMLVTLLLWLMMTLAARVTGDAQRALDGAFWCQRKSDWWRICIT